MPGDVNGDASINGRDLIRLRKYLLMNGVEGPSGAVEISEGADVNQDGVVNGKDLISLRRKLMAM